MRELRGKIFEALLSTLPITVIVYVMSLTPLFHFSTTELITFTVGAVMLVLGIGFFSLGADLAMTPMGANVGSGLSKQRKLGLLMAVCFVLGVLITVIDSIKTPPEQSAKFLFVLEENRIETNRNNCVFGIGRDGFL